MTHKQIMERLEQNPIIAAVQDEKSLERAIVSQVSTIFLLHADIFNVKALVDKIKSSNKTVFIHIDFLEGLGRDSKAIEYIIQEIKPDGIISTRSNHIKVAKGKGIFTIQRFFLIDTKSYDMTVNSVKSLKPDMIEVMPALMPNVIKRMTKEFNTPIIAGGLIDNKQDIIEILKAGALAASTGKEELWKL